MRKVKPRRPELPTAPSAAQIADTSNAGTQYCLFVESFWSKGQVRIMDQKQAQEIASSALADDRVSELYQEIIEQSNIEICV